MTDPTLAERLARCVRELEWKRNPETGGWFGNGVHGERWQTTFSPALERRPFGCYFDVDGPEPHLGHFPSLEAAKAAAQADYTARTLAALDMDALAREVEAMVGAEREACARVADDEDEALPGWGEARNAIVSDQVKRDVAAAIRNREGGKP
jgi:hypothetical protein